MADLPAITSREAKLTPIAVLERGMSLMTSKAEGLLVKVGQRLRDDPRTTPEQLVRIMELWSQCEDKARQYAKDLAPYIHPKVVSTRVLISDPDQMTDVELVESLSATLSPDELNDLLNRNHPSPPPAAAEPHHPGHHPIAITPRRPGARQ
jgi:hypothetical protein